MCPCDAVSQGNLSCFRSRLQVIKLNLPSSILSTTDLVFLCRFLRPTITVIALCLLSLTVTLSSSEHQLVSVAEGEESQRALQRTSPFGAFQHAEAVRRSHRTKSYPTRPLSTFLHILSLDLAGDFSSQLPQISPPTTLS